jgi:hypothetical protein
MNLKLIRNCIVAAALGARAMAFTYETPTELHLAADLDGDGRQDVVLIDRETGAFRVGYQLAAGVHTFSAARASGVPEATTASAGRMLNLTRDTLVVASPWANRVNLLDVPTAATAAVPTALYQAGIGPSQALAINIGGAGDTAHDDLFVITSRNGATPYRRNVHRWDGTTATTLENLELATEYRGLNEVLVKNGGASLLGVLERAASDFTLRIGSMATGTNVPVASATGFRSRYVFGRFGAPALHHFLSYDTGRSNIVVRAVTESIPNVFGFAASATYGLAQPIAQMSVLASAPANRLLVVFGNGSTAGVFTFNGASAPVLAQTLNAPAGLSFFGAVPLSNGEFHLLAGTPASGRSTQFLQYQPSGATYALKASGALPDPNPLGTPANVFLFAEEPFVSATPNLLKSLNSADWVSAVNLGGANVSATTERMGTSAQGLGNPAARVLGPKPAGANFGLVNQYAQSISMASFLPAIGDESGDVTILPPGGPQLRAIDVTLQSTVPTLPIWYRTRPDEDWKTTVGRVTFTLFRDSTVEFYGNPAGVPRSRIHRATYTFPEPPAEQDSDGDGVPDFVELANELNPNGGNDSDGDGYTDKQELFDGTDPLSESSTPVGRMDEGTSFDLVATPRALDGVTGSEAPLRLGQEVGLYDLAGSLLARRSTVPVVSPVGSPAAAFRDAPANLELGLLAMGTESHFPISGAGADPAVGRELLALLPVPKVRAAEFVFTPGAGDLLGQANAWITGAKAALDGLATHRIYSRFGPMETLGALLIERKIHEIFVARGKPGLVESNAITLFPHRPGDVLRTPLTASEVESLRDFGPGELPAWNLVAMHRSVSNSLPLVDHAALRNLANDIYRISSLSNNAAPGRYPLPVEALRQFIATGVLHSNYAAVTSITPAARTAAKTSVDLVLAAIRPRPIVTVDLVITPATFDGECTVLETVSGGSPRNLFTAPGVPFKFPQSFEIVDGAMIRVRAFNDLDEDCAGTDLQVISASLLSVPPEPLADVDGDMLPDAWECIFLAGNGDPAGDLDGDGIPNLQEYLDGTDPGDNVYKALAKVDLSPPILQINLVGDGVQQIGWNFPAAYANRFEFDLLATDALGEGFRGVGQAPTRLPGGDFEVNLPISDEGSRFFIIVQRLR